MIYCALSTVLVWRTTLNAKSGYALLTIVSAFKKLVTCTLVVSESCRLTLIVVDLCSFTQSWIQQARGIILSYSYHTQNQKICYATCVQISGSSSGRIVHLISGSGQILKNAIRYIPKNNIKLIPNTQNCHSEKNMQKLKPNDIK